MIDYSQIGSIQRHVTLLFGEREHCMLSPVRLSSVCRLSVMLVRRTHPVEIFGNISTSFGTLVIRGHPQKILWRSSKGNPSVWAGVKRKRGGQI